MSRYAVAILAGRAWFEAAAARADSPLRETWPVIASYRLLDIHLYGFMM
jgi:hypothetical protein